MQPFQTPDEDWDVVWDYTMGLPEDNGFTLTTQFIYIGDNPEMTENGVLYRPAASVYNPYFEFVPTGYTACNEAIFEADVKILEFNSGDNGMRLAISNGSSGAQIYVRSGSLYLQENRTQAHIINLSTNSDYIFKIIRKDVKNEVYLDNDLIYESTVASSLYNTKTRLMFQNGGEYLLKAIRFKKISYEVDTRKERK